MLVYVLNKNNKPLMPCKEQKASKLLKQGKAEVVKRVPFTIRLLFGSSGYKQEVSLGIDAGSKHIGVSATTKDKVLYESEVLTRTDLVELLSERRELRSARRNRKTRYRKARFNNRVHSKNKGWLAPSIENKINTHLTTVDKVCQLLPVSKIIVETASFDIQKIKNPTINGIEYQQGEQMDFWNVREYVLWRDGHTCQCCKGKSKDKVLNVHHIESRKTGGNAPNNLVTLCEYCHKQYHLGNIKLPKSIKRGASFKDAVFMGVMRWSFYNKLKELYPNVYMTYGYITKNTRITNNLPKEHYIDARCISGNPLAIPLDYHYLQKKVRRHNRQLHKLTINKGGQRKNNQSPYIVKGFRLFKGRRMQGAFVLNTLTGSKLEIVPSKITFVHTNNGYITELVKAE